MKYSNHLASLLIIVSALLSGCGTKFTHHDLPDNFITFSYAGGSYEYHSTNSLSLGLEEILIEGKATELKPLYNESKFIGYESDWVRFTYGYLVGKDNGTYLIEIQPNSGISARSAELRVLVSAKRYGELYIHQDGDIDSAGNVSH